MTDKVKEQKEDVAIKILNPQAQPTSMDVDVNVPNIRGNRTPNITGMLEKGFDWELWRNPYVIETSVEEGRRWIDEKVPSHKQAEFEKGFVAIEGYGMKFRMMFDGGHRQKMYKLAFPLAKTMRCDVYKVKSVETAHIQFVKIQYELQKRLHKDLLFVQSYYGGDSRINRTIANLKAVGLVVQHEDNVVGEESIGDLSVPAISKNGFEKITAKFDTDTIKAAVDFLKEALGFDEASTAGNRPRLNQYLVYAVSDVINELKTKKFSSEDIKFLVMEALKPWVSTWDGTGPTEQKDQLEGLHTLVFQGATLHESTTGISFQKLVHDVVLANKDRFAMVNIDPTIRKSALMAEKATRKYNQMQSRLKKTSLKVA